MLAATTRLPAGTVMNISGGSVASLLEAIDIVEEVSGRSIQLERHSEQAGDVSRTDADITRAQRLLGWSPRTSLEDGLRRQVEFARQRLGTAQAEIAAS